jgi:hypothetical protein
MSKPQKQIPKFAGEAAERAFWESPKNDSSEYIDWTKAKLVSLPQAPSLHRDHLPAHA